MRRLIVRVAITTVSLLLAAEVLLTAVGAPFTWASVLTIVAALLALVFGLLTLRRFR